MGNGEIGYDIDPFEVIDEIAKGKSSPALVTGLKEYIKKLEDKAK